eukprot:scaffold51_cov401-Prasinococcus_capsulatus_cf.AAC.36
MLWPARAAAARAALSRALSPPGSPWSCRAAPGLSVSVASPVYPVEPSLCPRPRKMPGELLLVDEAVGAAIELRNGAPASHR